MVTITFFNIIVHVGRVALGSYGLNNRRDGVSYRPVAEPRERRGDRLVADSVERVIGRKQPGHKLSKP